MAACDPPARPARKTARKAAAKKAAPRKRAPRKVTPTAKDRADAAAQIDNVVPIKGSKTPSRRGRQNSTRRSAAQHEPYAPTAPEQLAIHARRELTLNLRRLGMQWEQVAAHIRDHPEFGPQVPRYTKSDAYKDAKTLIDAVTVEAVQGVREDDLAMLLALQRKVFPAALDGDLKAVDRMLKILDQRARYLGLYAPTRHELTGTGGGPIALAPEASPTEVFDAAWTTLDEVLPHKPAPQLPAPPG